jgi:hypothetical protein
MKVDEVERALRALETHLPFLRRHVAEYVDRPTGDHKRQAVATLNRIEESTFTVGTFLTQQARLFCTGR